MSTASVSALVGTRGGVSEGPSADLPVRPLYGYLASAAGEFPDRPWLSDGKRSVSYATGDALVAQVALGFVAQGIEPGDRVAICMPNNLAYPVIAYACWRIGAVVVGLNPLYAIAMLHRQIA